MRGTHLAVGFGKLTSPSSLLEPRKALQLGSLADEDQTTRRSNSERLMSLPVLGGSTKAHNPEVRETMQPGSMIIEENP